MLQGVARARRQGTLGIIFRLPFLLKIWACEMVGVWYGGGVKKGGKRKLHVRPAEFAVAARKHGTHGWRLGERLSVALHAPWDANHPAGAAHHAPKPEELKARNQIQAYP